MAISLENNGCIYSIKHTMVTKGKEAIKMNLTNRIMIGC